VQGAAAQRRRLRRERATLVFSVRAYAGCRWSRAAWSSSASPASGSRATSSAAPTPPTTGALAPARSHVLCPLRPASAALHLTRDALTVGGGFF